MNYVGSTSSWKPWRWMRLDLILLMRDIYINSNLNPITKFTEFKDILSWNIPERLMKTSLISTRIVISYAMKQGIPLWIWRKVNGNWDNTMIRISQWRESHCRTNTSIRNKSKRAGLWESVSDLRRKVNFLNKVVWDRISKSTRSISSTRIGKLVLMMDVKSLKREKH